MALNKGFHYTFAEHFTWEDIHKTNSDYSRKTFSTKPTVTTQGRHSAQNQQWLLKEDIHHKTNSDYTRKTFTTKPTVTTQGRHSPQNQQCLHKGDIHHKTNSAYRPWTVGAPQSSSGPGCGPGRTRWEQLCAQVSAWANRHAAQWRGGWCWGNCLHWQISCSQHPALTSAYLLGVWRHKERVKLKCRTTKTTTTKQV